MDTLSQFGAVQLFVERAQAVRPELAIDDENVSDVVEICRRLDGLPLAIELAAARVTVLPPHALLERLDRRLRLLTTGANDQPPRLRTMRSGIAWSYELLTIDEQFLFRRLAVFASACTMRAIESIFAGRGSSALDSVSGLVDNSLLQPAAIVGEPRFVMLETIREYALERLEASGEEIDARRAHVAYYMARAQEAESAPARAPTATMERRAGVGPGRSPGRVGVDPERVRAPGGRGKWPVDGRVTLVFLVPARSDG